MPRIKKTDADKELKITRTKRTSSTPVRRSKISGLENPKKGGVRKITEKIDLNSEVISIKKKVAKVVQEFNPAISTDEHEVKLPQTAPVRLIRKSELLSGLLDNQVAKSVYHIAYIGGVSLVLVGTTLSLLRFAPNNPLSQPAELLTSVQTVQEKDPGVTQTNVIPTPIGNTEFDFVTTIPDHVTEGTPVKFVVTNAANVVAKLAVVGRIGFIDVPTELVGDSTYKAQIPAEKMSIGYYELRIYVKPLNGSPSTSFASSKFFVGTKDQEDFYISMQKPKANPVENSTSTVTDNSDANEEDNEPKSEGSSVDTKKQPEVVKEPKDLELLSPVDVISDTAVFTTKNSDQFSFLELYLRPSKSITPRFVSLAIKRFGNWQFIFNTKDIPNGDYEFFIKSNKDGKSFTSDSVKVKVKNQTIFTENSVNAPVKVEPSQTSTDTQNEDIEPRVFVDTDEEPDSETSSNETSSEVTTILKENSNDFSELLHLYAVAFQAGDPALIQSTNESLNKKRTELALKTLENSKTHYLADDIDNELKNKISELQEKVVTFEGLRKEKSGGKSAIDTDSDGVSDVDEEKLYKTDPKQSDSDGDGTTDGIEIVRGFDPLDEEFDSAITFESPKESSGLVRPDAMVVENVTPVVKTDSEKPLVAAEIRGRALPDSFVNIYIFSTPIVVTVRTDADGSFVYTFDKELEDGEHDIYVAMTDNTGEIVAQSNPFSFIKQAQAFTPVDAAETQIITSEVPTDLSKNTYSTVVGVGILALGLILLILGMSLKTKETSVIEEDIKA